MLENQQSHCNAYWTFSEMSEETKHTKLRLTEAHTALQSPWYALLGSYDGFDQPFGIYSFRDGHFRVKCEMCMVFFPLHQRQVKKYPTIYLHFRSFLGISRHVLAYLLLMYRLLGVGGGMFVCVCVWHLF